MTKLIPIPFTSYPIVALVALVYFVNGIGISHIDLNVSDYARSIRFYDMILLPLGWKRLGCRESWTSYSDGEDDYYAVFFEDPDRMKLEVVYSPNYCKLDH